jgi:hypothetical protein
VVPGKAAAGLMNRRGWHGMQGLRPRHGAQPTAKAVEQRGSWEGGDATVLDDCPLGATPAIKVEPEALELVVEGFLFTDPAPSGDPVGERPKPGRMLVA